jgi:tRNA (cmo5U34)-methyltransferase
MHSGLSGHATASFPRRCPGHTGGVTSVQSQKHTPTAGWDDPGQVDWYLDRLDGLPPRIAGEDMLREVLPPSPESVLDLGCGDGRLAALVLEARSTVKQVLAVDRSPAMLERARERFRTEPRVTVRQWDLAAPIGPLGTFDVIVSGFAIHHLESGRKRDLFSEVAQQLRPDGLFANLEVVASATPELHAEFLAAIGRTADDPEDRLVDVETQAEWMRQAGLEQVDCLWRWRGFALLVGRSAARELGV